MAQLTIKNVLFTIQILLLSVCTSFAERSWPRTVFSTSITCAVFHESTWVRNATQTIPRDQLPTFSVTKTLAAGVVKTVVLTPRPSIKTEDATRVWWAITSVTRPDPSARIQYTSTVTSRKVIYVSHTLTETVTETVSPLVTSTIPALAGYTPLRAKDDSAAQRLLGDSVTGWALQDEYWDPDAAAITKEDFKVGGNYPTAVTCFFTEYFPNFSSTATIKRPIPQETFTRTRYVTYTTWTKTVNVYSTPRNPNATIMIDYTTYSTRTTYGIGSVTTTVTVSVFP